MKALNLIGHNLLILISFACLSACNNQPVVPQIMLDIEEENYFEKNMEFDSSEGEKTFSFNTNVEWFITVSSTSNEDTWCTVTPDSGPEGDNTVRIKVKENNDDTDRKAILTLSVGSTLTKTITVVQEKNISLPSYTSYVTISGDDLFGYTFYADFGSTLRPTSTSVQEVLPGLGKSGTKRAYIAFDLASETENGQTLESGKSYDIILRPDYTANYAIPTYGTLLSMEPTDSLHTKNGRIQNVNNNIWAINGYVNAHLTLDYDQSKPFYLNAYYTEQDIDAANNTLNLNLYYNSNSKSTNSQGSSVFSFKLPEQVAYNFTTDSVNLVLNAITGYNDSQLTKVAECKVAIKDFYAPRYY